MSYPHHKQSQPVAHIAGMDTLAWCVSGLESNHEFAINTGNGFTGGYQFTRQTWQTVLGAMGITPLDPNGLGPDRGWTDEAYQASPAEQTAAFFALWFGLKNGQGNVILVASPGAWPNTGPRCS